MKLKSTLEGFHNGPNYIPIPSATAEKIIQQFGKRILCSFGEERDLHCAIMRTDQIGYFIMIGKKNKAKFKFKDGQLLNLEIVADESKYQADIPEVLVEVLETDIEAYEAFEALTPGKQRSIIHRINSAKRIETQIKRALKIAENLKTGDTDPRSFLR